jgi:hypothetical protein
MPLFIGFRRPKSTLIQISLGGVLTEAESVGIVNFAIAFP